jgi:hypothetical protein
VFQVNTRTVRSARRSWEGILYFDADLEKTPTSPAGNAPGALTKSGT